MVFLRPQVQIHDSVISPLYWAVRDGKLDMARLMIQARADTDQRALAAASRCRRCRSRMPAIRRSLSLSLFLFLSFSLSPSLSLSFSLSLSLSLSLGDPTRLQSHLLCADSFEVSVT